MVHLVGVSCSLNWLRYHNKFLIFQYEVSCKCLHRLHTDFPRHQCLGRSWATKNYLSQLTAKLLAERSCNAWVLVFVSLSEPCFSFYCFSQTLKTAILFIILCRSAAACMCVWHRLLHSTAVRFSWIALFFNLELPQSVSDFQY